MVDSVDSYRNPSGLMMMSQEDLDMPPNYQDFQVLDQPNVAGLTYGDSPIFQAGLEKASKTNPYSMGLAALAGKIQGNPVAAPVGGGFHAPSVESIIGKNLEQAEIGDIAKLESTFTNPYGHEISHLGFDAPQLSNFIAGLSYGNLTSPLMGTTPGTIVAGSEELPNYIHDAIYGNQPISQHLIKSGYAEDGAFTQQAYEDLQSMGLPQSQLDAIGMGGLSPYTPAYEGGIHAASAQLADIRQSIADNLFATPDYSQVEQMNQLANQIAATTPTMAENLLLDNNGNLFKASSNESYQAAIEQGYARPATQTGPTMADVAGPTVDYEPTIEPSPPSPALIDDPFNRPWATDSQRSSGPSGLDLSDPGEPLGFGTTHGNLFDRQGNVKKFTNDQNFYSALMGGYSYGPRDFYLEQGYLNNPLVMSRYGGWNTGT